MLNICCSSNCSNTYYAAIIGIFKQIACCSLLKQIFRVFSGSNGGWRALRFECREVFQWLLGSEKSLLDSTNIKNPRARFFPTLIWPLIICGLFINRIFFFDDILLGTPVVFGWLPPINVWPPVSQAIWGGREREGRPANQPADHRRGQQLIGVK
jgi:hypothetical protein